MTAAERVKQRREHDMIGAVDKHKVHKPRRNVSECPHRQMPAAFEHDKIQNIAEVGRQPGNDWCDVLAKELFLERPIVPFRHHSSVGLREDDKGHIRCNRTESHIMQNTTLLPVGVRQEQILHDRSFCELNLRILR